MAEALKTEYANAVLIAGAGERTPPPDEEIRRIYGVDRLPVLRLLPISGRYGIHIFNLRAALAAWRLRPRLVISRSVGAAAFCARLGLPTVWECHGPPQRFERRYWRFMAGSKGFRRLVVISDALRRIMEDRFPETASMEVVVAHDGVDAARFAGLPSPAEAKRAANRDPARRVAGYAGHLYEGRGVGIILDCAKALPGWSFIVAGGTPEDQERTRVEIAERRLDNVELLGFVDNSALPERLAVADALLMPYQRRVLVSGGALDTSAWMSPLKMFEYLAMGRAILSSDLPVIREVLDEKVAILLDPDRPAAWVEALHSLEDGRRADGLARASAERARAHDWRVRVRRMTAGLLQAAA